MKLYRSPLPLLGVLIFLVVAIPLMDYVLLGFSHSPIEKTVISSPNIYASTQEPCIDKEGEKEPQSSACK